MGAEKYICSAGRKGKRGSEYLQTFLIIAVLGTFAVLLCSALSGRFKKAGGKAVNGVTDGLGHSVNRALSTKTENTSGL